MKKAVLKKKIRIILKKKALPEPLFSKVTGSFTKKETLVHVFFCEFCEIFSNSFLQKNLRAPASVFNSTLSINTLLLQNFKNLYGPLIKNVNDV